MSAEFLASQVGFDDEVEIEYQRDGDGNIVGGRLIITQKRGRRILDLEGATQEEVFSALAARFYRELLHPFSQLILHVKQELMPLGRHVTEVLVATNRFELWEMGMVTDAGEAEFRQAWTKWLAEAQMPGVRHQSLENVRRFERKMDLTLWARTFRTSYPLVANTRLAPASRLTPASPDRRGWLLAPGVLVLLVLLILRLHSAPSSPSNASPSHSALPTPSISVQPTLPPAVTPSASAPVPAAPGAYRVTNTGSAGLNVRDAPNGKRKGAITENSAVLVLDSVNGWDHIKGDNFDGYVSAEFLSGPLTGQAPALAKLSP